MSGETPVAPSREAILEVRDLAVDYGEGRSALHALAGIDLTLHRGELLGISGESGSGKSTFAAAITRLLRPPGRIISGSVIYHPRLGPPVDVLTMESAALQRWRWEEVSVVFQAAMNSLNPVARISAQLTDVLEVHRPKMDRRARLERARELAELVGIHESRLSAYPHQLSGGMRQRIMIAMALALDPEIVIMDEPTTALDVVVQREILTRMSELRAGLGFSVIFITHDMSLLLELADEIAVMYAGKLVELAPAEDLHRSPLHPYTEGLLGSFPSLVGARRELVGLVGSPPDLRHVPSGCSYHERCPIAQDLCARVEPELKTCDRRSVACHFRSPGPVALPTAPVAEPEGQAHTGLIEVRDA
jgi:peptide/nickel transport system ATP-binding protein